MSQQTHILLTYFQFEIMHNLTFVCFPQDNTHEKLEKGIAKHPPLTTICPRRCKLFVTALMLVTWNEDQPTSGMKIMCPPSALISDDTRLILASSCFKDDNEKTWESLNDHG